MHLPPPAHFVIDRPTAKPDDPEHPHLVTIKMRVDRRALRAVTLGFLCLGHSYLHGGPSGGHRGDSTRDGGMDMAIATVAAAPPTPAPASNFEGTSATATACADRGGGHAARAMFVLMSMCLERGWALAPVPMDNGGTRYTLTIMASATTGREEYQGKFGSIAKPAAAGQPTTLPPAFAHHMHRCILGSPVL